MRILVIRHADGRDPGVLERRAVAAGHELVFREPHLGEDLPASGYEAVVVLGGSVNVTDGLPYLEREIDFLAATQRPVLGICLGSQLLAASAGAAIRRALRPEIGFHEVRATAAGREDPLFSVLPERFDAYQWHSYTFEMPHEPLAQSDVCPQAFRLGDHAWGVQFHPEVEADILADWIAGYRSDADAVTNGFDPRASLAELPKRLPEWNRLGADLFDRFFAIAASGS